MLRLDPGPALACSALVRTGPGPAVPRRPGGRPAAVGVAVAGGRSRPAPGTVTVLVMLRLEPPPGLEGPRPLARQSLKVASDDS